MKTDILGNFVELLEPRIAPAIVIQGNTATYTDVDGDLVTIKTSAHDFTGSSFVALNVGMIGSFQLQQLETMSLSGSSQAHANFTITAKPQMINGVRMGDGLANIGFINAPGLDLGTVTIHGDLAKIVVGDSDPAKPAVKALNVQSMGRFGTSTGSSDLASSFADGLGSLHVTSDFVNASISATGGAAGKIGAIFVGGSVQGSIDNGGLIESTSDIGPVKIMGDLSSSTGSLSGSIKSGGKLTSVFIGGSVMGGTNAGALGQIFSSGDMGPVKVMHNLLGGAGNNSATIASQGKLASVFVGGSVQGAAGSGSGSISSFGDMGPVKIGGDLSAGSANETGKISSKTTLSSVTINGSIFGSSAAEDTNALLAGQIAGTTGIGSVTVKGSVVGGGGSSSGRITSSGDIGSVSIEESLIGSSGVTSAQIGTSGKIGNVKIGGNVVGGSSSSAGAIYGNVGLGSIKITGSLIGGAGSNSGTVSTSGPIQSVVIGGDLQGGSAPFNLCGAINGGNIGPVTVDGDIVGGTVSNIDPHAIEADGTLGKVTVKGSIIGSATVRVLITAAGLASPKPPSDLAIAGIHVSGRVEDADIKAGYVFTSALYADAQIGSVVVGGDWVASNLVAGAQNLGADGAAGGAGANADNVNYGDSHDGVIAGGNAAITSKIASIVIGGQVLGTPGGSDHFGFVSQQVGSFKAAGLAFLLKTGASNDNLAVGATGDVTIHEV